MNLIVMVYMTWQAMSGNGVPIGMERIIIAFLPKITHRGLTLANTGSCVGVLGTTLRNTYVLLTAAAATQSVPTSMPALVFDASQNPMSLCNRLTVVYTNLG